MNSFRKILVVSFAFKAFFIGFSCSNNNIDNSNINLEDTSSVTEYDEADEIEKVYIIDKKSVIFFMPGKKEYNKLYKEVGESYRYELDYLFNNFKNQYKYFKKELQKKNIFTTMRYDHSFQITKKDGSASFINIVKDDQIMGEILFDGVNDARVEYGMYTNKEFAIIIREFFNVENVTYINPEDTIAIENTHQNYNDTILIEKNQPVEIDSITK